MALDQLLPEYQAQYYALEPEIERSVRQSQNARGMFYSGSATDAEVRAKEQLLAELASKSAAARTSADQNERDRADARSGRKAQILSAGLGAGAGALSTMGTLYYLNRSSPGSLVTLNDKIYNFKDGKLTPLDMTGQPGAAAGAPPTVAGRPAPAGWTPMLDRVNVRNLAGGAAGGIAGSELGKMAFGDSKYGDIGAGAGGLAGYAAALRYGSGSPLTAGLAAGAGAFGGRGLAKLFS